MGLPYSLLFRDDPSTAITPDALAMNGKVVMLNASAKIDAGVANIMRAPLSMRIKSFLSRLH